MNGYLFLLIRIGNIISFCAVFDERKNRIFNNDNNDLQSMDNDVPCNNNANHAGDYIRNTEIRRTDTSNPHRPYSICITLT